MRRTDRAWGRIEAVDLYHSDCPVCGRELYLLGPRLMTAGTLPGHLTEGLVTCNASGKTMEAAEELAAFRQRAHP
jgi:hypothetical protein